MAQGWKKGAKREARRLLQEARYDVRAPPPRRPSPPAPLATSVGTVAPLRLLSVGPGPARARYFIFHHIPITPIGGPGPGPGPVFYLSSPYTHHSYWQVFYLSSLYTHHSTIPKNGRVVFLGKIKEYVACKQPNKEDKIKTKLTWEGLK